MKNKIKIGEETYKKIKELWDEDATKEEIETGENILAGWSVPKVALLTSALTKGLPLKIARCKGGDK